MRATDWDVVAGATVASGLWGYWFRFEAETTAHDLFWWSVFIGGLVITGLLGGWLGDVVGKWRRGGGE